ncbi:TRAP transporter small permease [Shouchella sp. 1P01AA]
MKVFRMVEQHIEEVLLVIILSIMVLAISLQIFMRFVLGTSLGWSEELARYCFIYLVFIGISYGVKEERHIKIDAILSFLNEKRQLVFNLIVYGLFLLFALFIVIYGGAMSLEIIQLGQVTPGLGMKMGYVYVAAPIGMLMTSIRIIQKIKQELENYYRANQSTHNEERETYPFYSKRQEG